MQVRRISAGTIRIFFIHNGQLIQKLREILHVPRDQMNHLAFFLESPAHAQQGGLEDTGPFVRIEVRPDTNQEKIQ